MLKNVKKRREHGWKPGQSGNPKGRLPIESKKKIEELFGKYTQEAVNCIIDIMRTETDSRARFLAAKYIIERVYGKIPEQVVAEVNYNGDNLREEILAKLQGHSKNDVSKPD